MKIEIKHRWSGEVLFECDAANIRAAVELAIKSKANLSEANLSGANLSWADLRIIKHDVWGVLLLNKNEVPALRDALVQGKVNGTVYSGECSCLCGTLAKAKGLDSGEELAIARSSSPAERFFLAIRTGDTPETNAVSKIALQWVDEFLALIAA